MINVQLSVHDIAHFIYSLYITIYFVLSNTSHTFCTLQMHRHNEYYYHFVQNVKFLEYSFSGEENSKFDSSLRKEDSSRTFIVFHAGIASFLGKNWRFNCYLLDLCIANSRTLRFIRCIPALLDY